MNTSCLEVSSWKYDCQCHCGVLVWSHPSLLKQCMQLLSQSTWGKARTFSILTVIGGSLSLSCLLKKNLVFSCKTLPLLWRAWYISSKSNPPHISVAPLVMMPPLCMVQKSIHKYKYLGEGRLCHSCLEKAFDSVESPSMPLQRCCEQESLEIDKELLLISKKLH